MNELSLTRSKKIVATLAFLALFSVGAVALAQGITGAIYTTDFEGVRVNQNIYQRPADVYLNGGPNHNNFGGLPPGIYYFEVTNPSGNVLLSTDDAECRQLIVNADGRVAGADMSADCFHVNGAGDATNGSTSVRLMPFSQTPNNGGEYKVTVIRKDAPGVTVEEDHKHIDYPRSAAKSDNFKVRQFGGID